MPVQVLKFQFKATNLFIFLSTSQSTDIMCTQCVSFLLTAGREQYLNLSGCHACKGRDKSVLFSSRALSLSVGQKIPVIPMSSRHNTGLWSSYVALKSS